MKYVAWLRGINVGGKAKVAMRDLQTIFTKEGFTKVVTYINSGNVIFESTAENALLIQHKIERILRADYSFEIRVVVINMRQLQETMEAVPSSWENATDLRCYVAFIRYPVKPADILPYFKLREGVDTIQLGSYAVFLSAKIAGLYKSGLKNLIKTPIYHDITIRNFRTCQKVLDLMGK